MKKVDDLQNILKQEPTRDLDCIVKANSYKNFVKKMLKIIDVQK